jgi:site-specific recombinase XerC
VTTARKTDPIAARRTRDHPARLCPGAESGASPARSGEGPGPDRSHIERLVKSLREDRGLSHRTAIYTLGAIRQVLAYGISSGLIAVNVATHVKVPRKQHSDSRPVEVW